VTAWNKQFMAQVAELFADRRQRLADQATDEQIGRLKMEVERLKKTLPRPAEVRRQRIDPNHKHLSVARQCQLIGSARSSWQYEPLGESAEDVVLMREIDRPHIKATAAVDDGDQFLTALGPGSNENEQALLLVALVFQPNPFGPSLAAIDE
jgi:hypothetical protein